MQNPLAIGGKTPYNAFFLGRFFFDLEGPE
jgi:hypothetical protein